MSNNLLDQTGFLPLKHLSNPRLLVHVKNVDASDDRYVTVSVTEVYYDVQQISPQDGQVTTRILT